MKDFWEHTKDEIRNREIPLSDNAWQNMSGQLDQQKKGKTWLWALLVLLAVSIGGVGVYQLSTSGREKSKPSVETKIPPEKGEEKLVQQAHPKNTVEAPKQETKVAGENRSEALQNENAKPAQKPANHVKALAKKNQKIAISEPAKTFHEDPLALTVPALSASFDLKNPDNPIFKTGIVNDALEQTTSDSKTRKHHLGLELRVFVSETYNIPTYTYNTQGETVHKSYLDDVKNGIKPGLGVDAGAELRIRVFNHFRISTGVGIRKVVTQNNYSYQVSEIPVIDSASGNIISYIQAKNKMNVNETSTNSFTYFNLPVSLYYEWPLNQKWTITAEAINNFSFLINANGKQVNPLDLSIEDQPQNTLNQNINSYQLRLGLKYALSKNLDVALEPAYRSYYNDFFRQGPISWKPRDFSLSLSAIVTLGKPKE